MSLKWKLLLLGLALEIVGFYLHEPAAFLPGRVAGVGKYRGRIGAPGAREGEAMSERKRLVSDDDGHDYVIPAERQAEWWKWLASDDAMDGFTPEWAERLNMSPNHYSFTDWREDR